MIKQLGSTYLFAVEIRISDTKLDYLRSTFEKIKDVRS